MIRRNDVVMYAEPELYSFYGRVIRIINDKALWICCGLHIHLTPISQLEKVDYRGNLEWTPDGVIKYWHNDSDGFADISRPPKFVREPRFVRMTTLRKLKQRASRYHGKNVWNTPLDYEYLRIDNDNH